MVFGAGFLFKTVNGTKSNFNKKQFLGNSP
jgi:hypothetical protein